MYCFQCGKKLKETSAYCASCGVLQDQNPATPSTKPNSGNTAKDEVVQLVMRAMNGDDSVWGEIYEKTRRYVYFLALKFLRSEQDAQDITQEVYIQAIRSVGQLYSPDSFFGWLRSIVNSKCKDLVKKKTPALLEDEAQGWLENIPEINDRFLPDVVLDSTESRRMILELVDSLSYKQRQTVLFYYYDEMTIDQIATLMECPAGTVKSRLNLARIQIKNGIHEHERRGVKLYGAATLPVLSMLLRDQAVALPIPPSLDSGIGYIMQASGSSLGTSTPAANTVPPAPPQPTVSALPYQPTAPVTAGGATGSAATTVAGASAMALSTKIIICVVVVLVICGGAFLLFGDDIFGNNDDAMMASPPPPPPSEDVAVPEIEQPLPPPPTPEPDVEFEVEQIMDFGLMGDYVVFTPILEQFRADAINLVDNQIISGILEYSVSYLGSHQTGFTRSVFGFALEDLNGDGVSELILLIDWSAGASGAPGALGIVAIYSIVDNAPHELIVHSSEDQRVLICTDHTVRINLRPDISVADATWLTYRVSPDGSYLQLQEGVGIETGTGTESQFFYYEADGERTEITSDEWNDFLDHWDTRPSAVLTFIPLFDEINGNIDSGPEPVYVGGIGWREAYRNRLLSHASEVSRVSLVDLTGDGIPELIFSDTVYGFIIDFYVYSYSNGWLYQLVYIQQLEAQVSAVDYHAYLTNDGRLIVYGGNGGEGDFFSTHFIYADITAAPEIIELGSTWYVNWDPDSRNAWYLNGEEISQAQYEAELNSIYQGAMYRLISIAFDWIPPRSGATDISMSLQEVLSYLQEG